jgi:Domain of unknown function (DUF4258)
MKVLAGPMSTGLDFVTISNCSMKRPMIHFLSHAEEAIIQRAIEGEWIIRTLTAPDWSDADDRQHGRHRSYKAIPECGGRILRVVHWIEGSDVVVLTVFFDRNALKARRP